MPTEGAIAVAEVKWLPYRGGGRYMTDHFLPLSLIKRSWVRTPQDRQLSGRSGYLVSELEGAALGVHVPAHAGPDDQLLPLVLWRSKIKIS